MAHRIDKAVIETARRATSAPTPDLIEELRAFAWDGQATAESATTLTYADGTEVSVPTFVNEFWTSKQRHGHSLHEVSYRACFKPQLPRFFIDRLTRPGDAVYDPFAGRGTTPLEAALAGRVPVASDINPLSAVLLLPRLAPPDLPAVKARLEAIPFDAPSQTPDDLLTFYHPETLREIGALRAYLLRRQRAKTLDDVDRWIRMVAVNRLTGHSAGFFSVYTLPPNQATTVVAQRKINKARRQTPPRRLVPDILLKKSKSLLRDCTGSDRETLARLAPQAQTWTRPAHDTPGIADGSVSLVVTSPPFLDIVNYRMDNWLRCWFCGIESGDVKLTVLASLKGWRAAMARVFLELHRVLKPGGYVAFEVGEVRKGTVRLEESVLPAGHEAGLEPVLVLINAQEFTKTANVWGVSNNRLGTNTNRIVVFRRA